MIVCVLRKYKAKSIHTNHLTYDKKYVIIMFNGYSNKGDSGARQLKKVNIGALNCPLLVYANDGTATNECSKQRIYTMNEADKNFLKKNENFC